jgi:hypothetical protein
MPWCNEPISKCVDWRVEAEELFSRCTKQRRANTTTTITSVLTSNQVLRASKQLKHKGVKLVQTSESRSEREQRVSGSKDRSIDRRAGAKRSNAAATTTITTMQRGRREGERGRRRRRENERTTTTRGGNYRVRQWRA